MEKFQRTAMLCHGNFIYAFRTLSRLGSEAHFRKEIGEQARSSEETTRKFTSRGPKLLDVDLIAREETPLVGYLSASEIVAEVGRARLLRESLPDVQDQPTTTWEQYESRVLANANEAEHRALLTVLASFRDGHEGAGVTDFAAFLHDTVPELEGRSSRLEAVRQTASRNQDVYLTWDHMDVYFATSMRKRWEYEDLFDFVSGLMGRQELADLNLRYFDPTQAFTDNRVNKGIVESLMLKRAKCTVYSVQDTDTLGKDSELAATLAQGKPVIAYVPTIDVEERVATLAGEDPVTVQDRLRFVIYADETFAASLAPEDYQFVREFRQLEEFEQRRVWRSVTDPEAVATLREAHAAEIERLCRIIASSEARIYDKRARTLRVSHPLAIQVNLDTGVANGVLVVRSVEDCARLLRNVLTNSMEFDLEDQAKERMCYLRERISGCVYRVVSRDRKLTNCFWNFYRRP